MKVAQYEEDNQCEHKNRIVKDIMACIYGSLCSHNKKYLSLHKPVNIDGNKNVTDIGDNVVEYTEVGHLFKYNFARLGPFLTASVRLKMMNLILPIRQHVYKYITDSILSDIPLENHIKVGEKIGEFKPDNNNGQRATIFKNGKKTKWG
jgi:hypothetical protein